jgi:hypothetical protein
MESTLPIPLSKQISPALQTGGHTEDDVNSWQVQKLLDHHHVKQSAIQYHYGDGRSSQVVSNTTPPRKKRKTSNTAV